jgi:hypothetical protein
LAEKYSCEPNFTVAWTGWQSGKFGLTNYNRCLWVAVAADGLYLKTGPLFFFRAFHQPVRIPWSAIRSVEENKIFMTRAFVVKIADPDMTITIYGPALGETGRYIGDKLKLLDKKN